MSSTDAHSILEQAQQPQGWLFWLLLVTVAASSVINAFLLAYAKHKGKHWATKEDFAELILQIRATTSATESVKAEITQHSWVHQKRWELKRDLYLSVLETLYEERHALQRLQAIDARADELPNDPNNELSRLTALYTKATRRSHRQLRRHVAKAQLVLDPPTLLILEGLLESEAQSFQNRSAAYLTERIACIGTVCAALACTAAVDLGIALPPTREGLLP